MAITPEQFFGKIGVKNGIFTEAQLQECFALQEQRYRETGRKPPLSLILFEQKLMTQEESRDLLQEFKYSCLRRDDKELADIAVERGIMTREQIETVLKFQRKLFRGGVGIFQLGEILISREILPDDIVYELHKELWQRRHPGKPVPRMAGGVEQVPAEAEIIPEGPIRSGDEAEDTASGRKICLICGYQNPLIATMCYGCGEPLSGTRTDATPPTGLDEAEDIEALLLDPPAGTHEGSISSAGIEIPPEAAIEPSPDSAADDVDV